MVGDYKTAPAIRAEPLRMYPAFVVGDPALMALDEAGRLIAAREFEAGAVLAADTVDRLPPAQRGRMFINAARNVIDAIPRAYRGLPSIESSRDVIAELEHSSSIGTVCASGNQP